MAERRELWRGEQRDWDASRLAFVDETGLNTKMAPLYGWAPRSRRCVAKVPHGHWKSSTFVGALTLEGMKAPWLLDGAMDGSGFLTYLRTQLVPSLKPGDTVICDNLSSHKVAGAREILESAGMRLVYLPPYSPDLNPIELAFSKLKTLMKKASARTFEALIEALGEVLRSITEQDCKGFFKHANYATC